MKFFSFLLLQFYIPICSEIKCCGTVSRRHASAQTFGLLFKENEELRAEKNELLAKNKELHAEKQNKWLISPKTSAVLGDDSSSSTVSDQVIKHVII